MTESNSYLMELLDQLQSDQLPPLDFDRLRETLVTLAGAFREAAAVADEAAVLRKDYEARIAGMAKAVATAYRKQDGVDEAVELVNSLPTFSAEQLIACYRRTAARFRDAFPASFGYLNAGNPVRSERLAHYKS